VARKELAGLDQPADAGAAEGQGLCTEQMTDATYGELIDRAKQRLARGESVIVDATWARTQHRERAAHAAAETSSELIALRRETR
jgi:predicted kinase